MELVVIRIAGNWSIMVDGRRQGRFDYEVDAVDQAFRLSQARRRAGEPVRILVQDRFGELLDAPEPPAHAA